MSGGKWLSCGPRVNSAKSLKNAHVQNEMIDFFLRSNAEKMEYDQKVRENIEELRTVNAERRARDKRDLDEEYRNYIPPIV